MNVRTLALALTTLLISVACASDSHASKPHMVPIAFELGANELAVGDEITIEELRGTSSVPAPGVVVTVRGKCKLCSHESGLLYFGTTTIAPKQSMESTVSGHSTNSVRERQTCVMPRGTNSFELTQRIPATGYMHVTLYEVDSGLPFSSLYFGQGEGVLRKKSWTNKR